MSEIAARMSHTKHAPTLPVVVDEAANTPGWVPLIGAGLFALLTLVGAVFYAVRDGSAPTNADDAAAAAPAEAPAAPSPSADAPKPVAAPE